MQDKLADSDEVSRHVVRSHVGSVRPSIEPGVSLEPKEKEPQARVLDLAIPVE